jgi:hypothetical protein
MSGRVVYDQNEVVNFRGRCIEYMDTITDHMLIHAIHAMETLDLIAYTNKDDWTLAKATTYRCNILSQLAARSK